MKRTEGLVTQVHRRDDGFIDRLDLADGTSVRGDFFLDCSGSRALLIGKALGVEAIDWSSYLPCDRAIAGENGKQRPARALYARHRAEVRLAVAHSLQSRIGQGYVYSSRFCSDSEAKS